MIVIKIVLQIAKPKAHSNKKNKYGSKSKFYEQIFYFYQLKYLYFNQIVFSIFH